MQPLAVWSVMKRARCRHHWRHHWRHRRCRRYRRRWRRCRVRSQPSAKTIKRTLESVGLVKINCDCSRQVCSRIVRDDGRRRRRVAKNKLRAHFGSGSDGGTFIVALFAARKRPTRASARACEILSNVAQDDGDDRDCKRYFGQFVHAQLA